MGEGYGHDLHAYAVDAIGRRARPGDRAGGGMNRPGTVWINGRLEPAERVLLTVTDRGFQVGDGIFETLLVVGGRVLELPLHTSRLQASAAVMAMPLPDELERLLGQAIADLCRANRLDGSDTQCAVRVTVSRGAVDGRLPRGAVRVASSTRVRPGHRAFRQLRPVDLAGLGTGR